MYPDSPVIDKQPDASPLSRKSLEDLTKSGLSRATIAKMGCSSMSPEEISRCSGVKVSNNGYAIPYPDELDQTGQVYCRYRLHTTTDRRYISGAGDDSRIYIPPGFRELPGQDLLVITEGEKKAAKAVQEGIACIAVQGVWSWADPVNRAVEKARHLQTTGNSAPHPALIELAETFRRVLILGDSDLLTNPQAKAGFATLEDSLLKRRTNVALAFCPPGSVVPKKAGNATPTTSKQGLDDWLMNAGPSRVQQALDVLFHANSIQREGGADGFMAQHFASNSSAQLAYSPGRGWMRYVGTHWEADRTKHRLKLVDEYAQQLRQWAAEYRRLSSSVIQPWNAPNKSEVPEDVCAWCEEATEASRTLLLLNSRFRKRGGVNDLLELAQPSISVPDEIWDREPDVLAVQNGIVDLRSGVLKDHDATRYITHCARAKYEPGAKCPSWEAFLRRVQPDAAISEGLQRMAGYCMTGETREQVFFLHTGLGANGKSTFQNEICEVLGMYAAAAPPVLIDQKADHREASYATADLAGKRLVVVSELRDRTKLAVAIIKRLTGEEAISARHIYAGAFNFVPKCKLLIVVNHKPEIEDTTHSISRRLRMTEWPETITPEELERDGRTLRKRLSEERAGILAWMVCGAVKYYKHGLPENQSSLELKQQLLESGDTIQQFINRRLVQVAHESVQSSTLYSQYCSFLSSEGHPERPGTVLFSRRMEEKGFKKRKDRVGRIMWSGLRMRTTDSADPSTAAGQTDHGYLVPAGDQPFTKPMHVSATWSEPGRNMLA